MSDEPARAAARSTVAEVARAAGVSVPTVSKVLNDRPGVSIATRRRVEAALRDHGYQRRRAVPPAGGLVELVFGDLAGPWAMEIAGGVERAAFAARYGVVISALRTRPQEADRWLELVTSRGADGLIFAAVDAGEHHQRFRELGVPFVVIDPVAGPAPGVPSIGLTHWRGAYSAAEHLVSLGHRRIATIGGPLRLLCSHARTDGFRAALAAAGVKLDDELVVHTDFSQPEGRAAAETLLELPDPPTAIFAASDDQAFGVYEAARRAGRRVPDDLSVVGFNDVLEARWAAPPLSTVREPIAQMTDHAVHLLLRLIDGQPVDAGIELATELVVRESTATPPRC